MSAVEFRDAGRDFEAERLAVRRGPAIDGVLDLDALDHIADAKLDEQGNLTGIDFETLKKDNAYMFTDQPRESAGGDPKGGAGSDGLADFRAAFGLTDGSSKE